MKKRKSLIFGIIIVLCVVVGFTTYPVLIEETEKSNREESTESVTSIAAQSSETSFSSEITSVDVLTDEDRAVKTEIEKYCKNAVDFRHKKQEVIEHQKFELTFFGVEEFQGKKELIAYKNDLGDEFLYKADTGKLFLSRIGSKITQKSEKSINIDTALITAKNYISNYYNIDELLLSMQKETEDGYFFAFSKDVFGYKTNATFEIKVSFQNDIVYIRDNVDVFENIAANINESVIEQKKQEVIASYADMNVEIEKFEILIKNNNIYLVTTVLDGTTGSVTEMLSKIN